MSKILFPTNGKPEFPNLTPDAIRGLKATMQIAKKTIIEQEEQLKKLKLQNQNLIGVLQRVISGEWTVAMLRKAWEDSETENKETNQ